jgi:hypothetical protein
VTLRDKLAAKTRRRLVVPIQVTDPTEDQQAWMGVMAAIEVERRKGDDADAEMLANLNEQADAAAERAKDHFAEIELQSLPQRDWEAACAEWADDDGQVDWAKALAPLLEASCVDEDLQDAEYWRDTMSREDWTEGDTDSLRAALLKLNVYAVDARVPKD